MRKSPYIRTLLAGQADIKDPGSVLMREH